MIHYYWTGKWQTYLMWGLLLTNNDYKHNDMKWNIIDKHLHRNYMDDEDEDDDKILIILTTTSTHVYYVYNY